MNSTLARATFRDPRFKKLGFASDAAFAKTKDKATCDVAKAISIAESTSAQQVYKAPYYHIITEKVIYC